MSQDWLRWHEEYASPGSSLARRLRVVQAYVRQALAGLPAAPRVLSMCAGDGRDVLPLLPVRARAVLVELDPTLAARARATAERLGLPGVTVVTGDAGITDPYLPLAPADLVLACGVFGNITPADARRTIAALPGLLAANGIVIWTRGRSADGTEHTGVLRDCFAEHGFAPLAFEAPDDARFRVGMHRLSGATATAAVGSRLFTFS